MKKYMRIFWLLVLVIVIVLSSLALGAYEYMGLLNTQVPLISPVLASEVAQYSIIKFQPDTFVNPMYQNGPPLTFLRKGLALIALLKF